MNRRSVLTKIAWLIALAGLLVATALPAAEVTEESIAAFMAEWKRGEALYNDYDYEGALAVLEPALAQVDAFPASSREAFRTELIEGYRYLAYSAIALEKYDAAAAAFVRILELDPTFDPGEVSPKIRAVFDKAALRVPGAAPVQIHHDPVKTFKAGEPITIRASMAPKPSAAVVFYKTSWWAPFKETKMLDVGEGIYVAVIPGRSTQRSKKIHYYIEARGTPDSDPQRMGSEKEPLEIAEGVAPASDDVPEIPETGPPGDF